MDEDLLDLTLAALADATRRTILARLAQGEATVNEIAAPLPMSLPAVSKHLRVLERAGLVERARRAQWRPCRLRPEGFRVAADWLEQYRELWEQRFDQLAAYLDEVQGRPPSPPAARPQPRPRPRPRPRAAKKARPRRVGGR